MFVLVVLLCVCVFASVVLLFWWCFRFHVVLLALLVLLVLLFFLWAGVRHWFVLHVDLNVDGERVGMCLVARVQQLLRHVCA